MLWDSRSPASCAQISSQHLEPNIALVPGLRERPKKTAEQLGEIENLLAQPGTSATSMMMHVKWTTAAAHRPKFSAKRQSNEETFGKEAREAAFLLPLLRAG